MSWQSRPLDGQTGHAHTPHTVWRGIWKRRSVRPLYPGDGVGVGIGAVVIAVVFVVVSSAVSNNSIPPTPQRILADAPEDSCRRRQNFLSAVDRHSAPESCSRSSRSQRPQPQLPSSSGAKAIPLPLPRLVCRVTARRSWHIMEHHVLRCRPWPRTSIDSNQCHAPWRMCDTGTANSRRIAIRAILCPSLALGGRGQCPMLNRAIARHNLLSEELPCRGLSPAPSPAPQATRSSSQSQSVLRTRR
jgi:hypothetical protein